MRIAIDAMGNDRGPLPIVEGVKTFLERDRDSTIILVGQQELLAKALQEVGLSLSVRLEAVHAEQVIEMHEKVGALREKRDSSIARLVKETKEGRADCMVALGNTAAAVGAASMGLRTLKGVHRPGIAVPMPTRVEGRPCVTIDLGANTVPKPSHLVDYGIMASTYCEKVLHISEPRVGLLNVGEERGKGNDLLREAYEILQTAPIHFVGNVEGGDIFNGSCDVVVCDGFVGNVLLKASEGIARAIMELMKQYFRSSIVATVGGMLARPALKRLKRQMDPENYGGAPLLGLNGICIIGHGGSSANAVYNALRVAKECVDVKLNDTIREQVAKLGLADDEPREEETS